MTSSSVSGGNPVNQSQFITPVSSGDLVGLPSHSDTDQAAAATTTTTKTKHRFAPSSAPARLQRQYSTGTGTVASCRRTSEDLAAPATAYRVNNHYVPVSLTSRGGGSVVVSPGKETTDTLGPSTVARQRTNSSSACGEFYFCFGVKNTAVFRLENNSTRTFV